MKIGITTFGGDGGKSGISQYIINILREFAALEDRPDFEVIVYEDEKELFVPDPDSMSTISFGDSLRSPVANITWHQISLPRLCRKQKYDVLFLPAGNRRLPVSLPCPSVGTVHDFSSIHVEGKYDPARMFYIKRVLPFLARKLTRVLTVSESSKRDIVEYARVPEEHVTVTPLAADNHVYFPRNGADCVRRIGPKYNIRPPYILYISRIEHPGKNHAGLIRAFSVLKDTGDIYINWSLLEATGIAQMKSTGLQTNRLIPTTSCSQVLRPLPICRTSTAALNYLSSPLYTKDSAFPS